MQIDTKKVPPVDPQLFVACSQAYHEGARFPLTPLGNAPGLYLADVPVNRGMMSVLSELSHRGESDSVKQAVMWRLMHFGGALNAPDLRQFLKAADADGAVMVSEALIKACAQAKFIQEGDRFRFDIKDIARITQGYFDADKDDGESK